MRKIGLFALFVILLVASACKPGSTSGSGKAMECTISTSVFPSVKPESAKVYEPITSSDWTKGPENATLTIIEYSDFT
jgi:hypothetical protein